MDVKKSFFYVGPTAGKRLDTAASYLIKISNSEFVSFNEIFSIRRADCRAVIISHCLSMILRTFLTIYFRTLGFKVISESRYRKSDKISLSYKMKIIFDFFDFVISKFSTYVVLESEQQFQRFFEKQGVVISNSLDYCPVTFMQQSTNFTREISGCKILVVLRGMDVEDGISTFLQFFEKFVNNNNLKNNQIAVVCVRSKLSAGTCTVKRKEGIKIITTSRLSGAEYSYLLNQNAIIVGQFEGGVRSSFTVPFRVREVIVSKSLLLSFEFPPIAHLNHLDGVGHDLEKELKCLISTLNVQNGLKNYEDACKNIWINQWLDDIQNWGKLGL